MKTIIYIASDSRSGSTLLDNMMSNHPQADSVGELRQLASHVNKEGTAAVWNWVCTCGKSIDECSVWNQVRRIYEKEQGKSFADIETGRMVDNRSAVFHPAMLLTWLIPAKSVKRWLFRRAFRQEPLQELGQTCYCLFDAFSRTVDAEIIIDSSKSVQQLHALIAAKPADVELKAIHIVRDGRSVLYSKMKRAEQYEEYGASFKLISAIRDWCYINLQILNTRCFFESKDMLTIRYEDLCNHREATLKRICTSFGIVFDEAMLHLSGENKHNIGGSSHRFDWNAQTPIRVDERWKKGMPALHKLTYYLTAGILHKCLGY